VQQLSKTYFLIAEFQPHIYYANNVYNVHLQFSNKTEFYSSANVEFAADSSMIRSKAGRYMLLATVNVTGLLSLLLLPY
jgi:hypothetical protein